MEPAAASYGFECEPSGLAFADGSACEVDIVVEIGQMPVQGRGVGEHPEFIFVEHAFAVDDFEHHLPSSWLCKTPMSGGCPGIDIVDVNFTDFGYDLVDGGTASEDLGNQL